MGIIWFQNKEFKKSAESFQQAAEFAWHLVWKAKEQKDKDLQKLYEFYFCKRKYLES